MSALRYSGSIQIRITYEEAKQDDVHIDGTPRNRNGKYRCFLRSGERTCTMYVGAPDFLSHSVDSPEAFDEAAHAAISFADDEHGGWVDEADFEPEGAGWLITRKPNARAAVSSG